MKEQGGELITQNLVISRQQMDWLQAEGRKRQCSASAIAREILRVTMNDAGAVLTPTPRGPEPAPGQIWECCRPGLHLGQQAEIVQVKNRWVDVRGETGEYTILRQHFRWPKDSPAQTGYRYVGEAAK